VITALEVQRNKLNSELDGALNVDLPDDPAEARKANAAIEDLVNRRNELDERIRVTLEQEASRRGRPGSRQARPGPRPGRPAASDHSLRAAHLRPGDPQLLLPRPGP
jgi:hypothetical protein